MNAEAEKLSTDIELEMKRVSDLAERAKKLAIGHGDHRAHWELNSAWARLSSANEFLHKLDPHVVTGCALPIAKTPELPTTNGHQ